MRNLELRVSALQRLRAGESVRQVAESVGVPKSTVQDWKRLWAAEDAQAGTPPASPGRMTRRPLSGTSGLFAENEPGMAGMKGWVPPNGPNIPPERPDPTNRGTTDLPGPHGPHDADAAANADTSMIGPGEPASEHTDVEHRGLEPVPDLEPPMIDQLHLEAWRRYFNLLQNDVPQYRAQQAVRRIDPDFFIQDEMAQRALRAVGKQGGQLVKFAKTSGWSAGHVSPPPHVISVYDQYEFTSEQQNALAEYLAEMAHDSYLQGLNEQLIRLGKSPVGKITDSEVLKQIESETAKTAAGIADTYNRALASEVYVTWVEHLGALGRQSSRALLADAIDGWASARSQVKAEQVAITEYSRWSNRGADDFADRNAGVLGVDEVNVTPDECVCQDCADLVDGNPYTPEEAAGILLPLHPNCDHSKERTYSAGSTDVSADDLWMGQEAGDGAPSEAEAS